MGPITELLMGDVLQLYITLDQLFLEAAGCLASFLFAAVGWHALFFAAVGWHAGCSPRPFTILTLTNSPLSFFFLSFCCCCCCSFCRMSAAPASITSMHSARSAAEAYDLTLGVSRRLESGGLVKARVKHNGQLGLLYQQAVPGLGQAGFSCTLDPAHMHKVAPAVGLTVTL